MLQLYHYGTALCAAKVRVVLYEKGLPWESRIVLLAIDGSKPPPGVLSNHDPAYLRLNPNGVVPTLAHDGKIIIESTVINEYLDETFPEVPLRPADTYERAQMRLWTKRLDEGLHTAMGNLILAIAYRYRLLSKGSADFDKHLSNIGDPEKRESKRQVVEQGIDAPLVVSALHKFQRLMIDMEQKLGGSNWLAGEAYSLADASYAPYMFRLETLQMKDLWVPGYPRVSDWYQRIKERRSFHEGIIAPAQPANIALLKEKGGEEWPKLRGRLLPLDASGAVRAAERTP